MNQHSATIVTPVPATLSGMCCPRCGDNDSRVLDSRGTMGSIRRRRACPRCGHRYTTFEIRNDFADGIEEAIRLDAMLRLLSPQDFDLVKAMTRRLLADAGEQQT
ncbi:MAG: hypothetical protein KBC46_03190 [Ferrovibrio sp.]|nr:hypothetical protein [Ferrovibrio sp.]